LRAKVIKDIDDQKEEFMARISEHKHNFLSKDCLHLMDLKRQ
jgi:hypothetical protein